MSKKKGHLFLSLFPCPVPFDYAMIQNRNKTDGFLNIFPVTSTSNAPDFIGGEMFCTRDLH